MSQERVLQARARESGRSLTRPRVALMQILAATRAHPTAAQLYDEVRKVLPGATLATVYRNLAVLQELGLVREIPAGTSAAHYDAIVRSHCHVHCERCDRVADVDVEIPEGWQAEAQANTKYVLTDQFVLFEGICPDCQAKQGTRNHKREDHGHVS
jgi:Fur family peroxide stress response transcriptional regulator